MKSNIYPDDWNIYALEECIEELIDYRGKTPKKSDWGIPLITAKIIKDGKILEPNEFITNKTYKSWMTRGMPQSGDVLITTEAPLGNVAQLKTNNVALAQRIILLRGKKGFLDNTFLRYVLQSPFVQNDIQSRATGTTVLGIKQSELRKVMIPVPSYKEQLKIANILVSLDNKIDINLRINIFLEKICEALFRRWFVEFEFPDEEGKPYRSNGGPMKQTPQGPIPKNWEIKELGDFINLIRGRSYRSKDLKESINALVTLKSIERGGGFKKDGLKEYVGKFKSEQIINENEIVIAQTDVTQKAEVIGKPARIPRISRYDKLIASLDLVIIRPKNNFLNKPYIYYLFKSDNFQKHIHGYTKGTTVLHLDREGIKNYVFILPDNNTINMFENIINDIWRKIDINNIENNTLFQLRDVLLLSLMSGEIRVNV